MEFLPAVDLSTLNPHLGWWQWLSLVGNILGLLHVPSVLLERGTRPQAALAWILCLLTLPFVGVILWWGLGRNYLERRRRKRTISRARISQSFQNLALNLDLPVPGRVLGPRGEGSDGERARTVYLHDDLGWFPTTADNAVAIFYDATTAYDSFEQAIRAARHHVHVQFYIWQRDATGRRFRDLLIAKAREGLEVRVMYDAMGGSGVTGKFFGPLMEAGGQVAPFLPLRLLERRLRVNFRNHRKILVVDGQTGFTGGVNIGDEYLDWMDLAFRFEGPVVYQLQEVFAEDWFFATQEDLASTRYFQGFRLWQSPREGDGKTPEGARPSVPGPAQGRFAHVVARIVASGPDMVHNTSHAMFFMAITQARERIYVMTPYFVPDQAITMALQAAALRGVDVRLLVPCKSDVPLARHAGRSYYEELLEVGVRVFEYRPRVLHAKLLIFDQDWSFVGSANMDNRSFRFNFEVNCVLESRDINRNLCEVFHATLRESTDVTLEALRQRSRSQKLLESAARLLSPLL